MSLERRVTRLEQQARRAEPDPVPAPDEVTAEALAREFARGRLVRDPDGTYRAGPYGSDRLAELLNTARGRNEPGD